MTVQIFNNDKIYRGCSLDKLEYIHIMVLQPDIGALTNKMKDNLIIIIYLHSHMVSSISI